MGYSYCSSELNLRIHIPKSQFHFPYSVTLGTKGLVISHLCTRVPFETATSSTRGKSLYPTFVVYFKGPYTAQNLSKNFSVIPELFYKFKSKFSIFQIFLKLFFKIRDLYLNRCPSQIFYKYMVTFSFYQIYLYFFFRFNFPSIFHHL
jgi:hypothetical protein